jgi:hypothetical protein
VTGKRIVLLIACAGLLFFAYQYALVWGTGHALALSIPAAWSASFPSRLSGTLTWMILVHTLAVLVVSVPFALLIARFGGPHAPVIALAITAALFAVFSLPPLIEFFGTMPPRMRVVNVLDQIKLILMLPLLVLLMRKLPSNNRSRGP